MATSIEDHIAADIRRVGWSVVSIFEDARAGEPGFTYTVGFEETLRFPEVLVFGLPPEGARTILNTLGTRIRKGKRPPIGKRLKKLAEGHELVLQEIDPAAAGRYMLEAAQRYDGGSFHALQLVWPDPGNRLPWEPGFDSRFRFAQPLLYEPEGHA